MRIAPAHFNYRIALLAPIALTILLGPKLGAAFFSRDVLGAEAAPARSSRINLR